MKLVIGPPALVELHDAVAFYTLTGNVELGLAFVTEFERAANLVLANPQLGAVFRGRGRNTRNVARWLESKERPGIESAGGESASTDSQGWRELKQQLYRHDWVVYAKQPLGGPAQVLEYLGRYTHRVAISNERLLEVGAERVRLRVRDAARPGGRRVIELPSEVFIARFLQHILPTGYKRIRHYGLLGPAAAAAGHARIGRGVHAADGEGGMGALSALRNRRLRGCRCHRGGSRATMAAAGAP